MMSSCALVVGRLLLRLVDAPAVDFRVDFFEETVFPRDSIERPASADSRCCSSAYLGFGRIVASETEPPDLLVNLA